MIYTHDISRAFSDTVGKEGADKDIFSRALKETDDAIEMLRKHKEDGSWPVLSVAGRSDDLKEIEQTAKHISDRFSVLVVVGMGGSGCGAKTLSALKENPFNQREKIAVHFVDNIDPLTSEQLLASLDFKNTLFLVVSKSGNTAETLAHMFVLMGEIGSRLGKETIPDHFLVITEPRDNPLRRISEALGIKIMDHDPNIGGRFAVFTVVGLLPALVAGVDIRAVRQGAAAVLDRLFAAPNSEPARGAALNLALFARGKTLSVMMPYCDRLEGFTAWYQQIWAESLGKNGKGTTPLRALGAYDQHSQLQLYLDGTRDKFMTLILLAQADKGPSIPLPTDASLAYLTGHTIGDLMDAEQRATAETLTRAHVPVRLFTLPRLDEEAMGALMMHFMLETMILAHLWHINAFDQPAVEESKRLARSYLMQKK